jgi:hypothetical protein
MDGVEINGYLTDPNNHDTDGDLLLDGWEVKYGFNPLVENDPNDDPDGDGLSNMQEYVVGTDPTNPDTDGDGANDGREVKKETDPLDPNDTPFMIPGYSSPIIVLVSFLALVTLYRKLKSK